jgi:hypothetical protein
MAEEDLRSQVKELRRALTEKGQMVSELQNTVHTLLQRRHDMAGAPPQSWGDLYGNQTQQTPETPQPPVRTYTEDEVQAMIDSRIAAKDNEKVSQANEAQQLVMQFAREHPDLLPYRGAVITAYLAAQGTMAEKVNTAVQQVRGMIANGMLPQVPQTQPASMPGLGVGSANQNRWVSQNDQGQQQVIQYDDEFLKNELAAWTNERKRQLQERKEAGYR